MSRLTPHVLHAVRRAHTQAVHDLDEARGALMRAEERVRQAADGYNEASAREIELARALAEHQAATADVQAADDAEARQRDRERATFGLPPGVRAGLDALNAPPAAEARSLTTDLRTPPAGA